MKLFLHNMLCCTRKECPGHSAPLIVSSTSQELETREFDPIFLQRMMPRIDYPVLVAAVRQLGWETTLPDELPEDFMADEALLRALHHVLFEADIVEGSLACPACHKVYAISQGIPRLVQSDDEP
jgi:multifunctional methyltransferase subunit TRM112